jgi:hypothetical protein
MVLFKPTGRINRLAPFCSFPLVVAHFWGTHREKPLSALSEKDVLEKGFGFQDSKRGKRFSLESRPVIHGPVVLE